MTPAVRWEYHTLRLAASFWGGTVDNDKMRHELNALGAHGWELVNVVETNGGDGSTNAIHFVFKRPVGRAS